MKIQPVNCYTNKSYKTKKSTPQNKNNSNDNIMSFCGNFLPNPIKYLRERDKKRREENLRIATEMAEERNRQMIEKTGDGKIDYVPLCYPTNIIRFSRSVAWRWELKSPYLDDSFFNDEDYAKKPSDLMFAHIVSAERNKTENGEKSYLDADDFTWHYDPEKKEAWTWMLNPEVYTPYYIGSSKNDDEYELFASCVSHIKMEDIRDKVIYYRFYDDTEEERVERNFQTYMAAKPYIERKKELKETLPKKIIDIQNKLIAGNGEVALQKKEIKSRLFDAIEIEKQNPEIEIPNGIFIFGESDLAINDLKNWIKSHQDVRIKTIEYLNDNPKESIDKFFSALKEAQSYWEITGKRTIIDISDFAELLTNYNLRKNRIAIGRFKNLAENAAKKFHSTLLLSTQSDDDDFEPSSISGQRFNIKVKLDLDTVSQEEKKELDDAMEELRWLDESKYYLKDFCIKIKINFGREIEPSRENLERIYTTIYERTCLRHPGEKRYHLITEHHEELPVGGWDPYESYI